MRVSSYLTQQKWKDHFTNNVAMFDPVIQRTEDYAKDFIQVFLSDTGIAAMTMQEVQDFQASFGEQWKTF